MSITPLPTPPSTSDPANFDARADAFLAALPTFVTEANAQAANLVGSLFTGTSASTVTVATGSKSFTATTGLSWQIGQPLILASAAAPASFMSGQVTAYNSGTGALTVLVTTIGGSGSHSDWKISPVPVDFGAGFSGSLTVNGWEQLPSGRIEQWGEEAGASPVTVTFPIAFPTACFVVVATPAASGNSTLGVNVDSVTTTGFVAHPNNADAGTTFGFFWHAIGH
jgi:hypothetical protein